MPYKVTRHSAGREFPNGEFDSKGEAEKHAEYVRGFHGKKRGSDVRVTKVGNDPDPEDEFQEEAAEADEAEEVEA